MYALTNLKRHQFLLVQFKFGAHLPLPHSESPEVTEQLFTGYCTTNYEVEN